MNSLVQNVSTMEDVSSTALFNVMDSVKEYYTPLLVFFGFSGNILVLFRLFSTSLHRLHFTAYLIGICIVDCLLLVLLLVLWLQYHNVWLYHIPGWCQGLTMMGFISNALAVWFVAGLATEALLTVRSPFQTGVWWPAWRPRFMAMIMSIVAVIVYLNICLLYAVIPLNNQQFQCLPLPKAVRTVQILDRLDIAFNFVTAYIVIASSVTGLSVTIRSSPSRSCDTLPASVAQLSKLTILLNACLVITGLPTNLLRLWLSMVQSRHTRISLLGFHQLLMQVSFARTLFNLPVCYFAWPDFRQGFLCRDVTPLPSRQRSMSMNNIEITEMETELDLMDKEQSGENRTEW